ncbi:21147_t:CDS:2, partial [Dentiscutata erythropus]
QQENTQPQKVTIPHLGALEEDDEFEEFTAEDWNEMEEDQETHLWEDNWDDEDVEDDFSKHVLLLKEQNGPLALQHFHTKMTEIFACRTPERWVIAAKLYFDTKIASNSETIKKQLYTIGYSNINRLFVLSEDCIIETETEMDIVISSLKNLWQHRPTSRYEGNAYSVGDFIVRAANPTIVQSSYQGMLVEVEYLPTVHPHVAIPLLHEFIDMIITPNSTVVQWEPKGEDSYSKVGLSEEIFTRTHTSYQYMRLFKAENLLLS